MRIIVLELQRRKQLAHLFQLFKNRLVRVFYKHSVPRSPSAHLALGIYHLNERQVILFTYAVIVLTERGRRVNYSRAVGKRYIIVRNYKMTFFTIAGFLSKFKQRLIFSADQRLALHLINNLRIFSTRALAMM